jgi:aminoglycoside phosphotransferase (APT) family kinase protein
MITKDDIAVASSDPALPGLSIVLDDDRLASELRAARPSVPTRMARRTYARYKPGRSCVVAYELDVGGSRLDVYARAHTRESFARRAGQLSGDLGGGTPLGSAVGLQEAAVIVRPFTGDRRIPALGELWDEDRRRRLLAELLPHDPSLWSAELERLRYWPERRFTCCLTVGGEPRAALKAYAAGPYSKAARAVAAFRDCRTPRIPRVRASSERHRIIVFEWLSGERLDRAMGNSDFDPAGVEQVGAALAELHLHPTTGLETKDPRDRAAFLNDRAKWVAAVDPELARRSARLAKRLAASLTDGRSEQRAIHGDFSPAQVLLNAASPAIIDLDDAGRGDPARDLGSFAAQLERRAIDGEIFAGRMEPFRHALLSGYAAGGGPPVDPDRVRLWTAVELFARAPGAFRRRGKAWRERVRALVARAEEVLWAA